MLYGVITFNAVHFYMLIVLIVILFSIGMFCETAWRWTNGRIVL